jgi:serine/threonine protein phosphatase PrpC
MNHWPLVLLTVCLPLQNYAFQELDEKFYKEVEGEEPPHCSGSTVLAALLQGPQLMVANAGDSRAVICKRGRAEDLSRDHRPALDSEQERVERCGTPNRPECVNTNFLKTWSDTVKLAAKNGN